MSHDYDLIVIGGGAAGLAAAGIGAMLGAKTVMIEQARLGGDCTWTGCVPSKTLLKAANVAWQARHAGRYGLVDQPLTFETASVMRHVRKKRVEVYEDADTPERYEALGVEVRTGRARFLDAYTVAVEHDKGTDRITGRRFVVASGGRPSVPPIDGLGNVPYLTSETLFELEELPGRMAVIGAGYVGTEMAQALNRLGTSVTVLNRSGHILPAGDPEQVRLLQDVLSAEGVRYVNRAVVRRVSEHGTEMRIDVERDGKPESVATDALLVATGRQPNIERLGLDAAGIAYTENGITVDERCRTSVAHIYAAGDVTGRYQFTHMSEHMAKVAATNALTRWPLRIDAASVPWVIFTDPELAHIGATEAVLKQGGASYEVYRFPFSKVDRAVTDGETAGLLKVFAKKWTGRILGATILGPHAGDLIGEFALALRNGLTLRQISDTIHPYPTFGLGVRRVADQWYVRSYSPKLVRLLQKVFGYRGTVLEADPDRIL